MLLHTARTARFSKKSPWSVFFRGEMSVICHKITAETSLKIEGLRFNKTTGKLNTPTLVENTK
jgi:hypothetical protein